MNAHDDTATPTVDDTATPTRKPTSKPTRAARPKASQEPRGKRSLNLSIPVEDYERFVIHAMRANTTISELFCKLGREHLREYHLTRTATRGTDARVE